MMVSDQKSSLKNLLMYTYIYISDIIRGSIDPKTATHTVYWRSTVVFLGSGSQLATCTRTYMYTCIR